MSRVHQALKKAERESSSKASLPSLPPLRLPRNGLVETLSSPPHEEMRLNPQTLDLPQAPQVFDLSKVRDSKLVSIVGPQSIPGKRYRILMTRLRQMRHGSNRLKTILITSTTFGEGKSLTALNLALALALEAKEKVLLVDGNLKRPAIHRTLDLNPVKGLSDFLSGTIEVEELILATSCPNFSVAPGRTISSHSMALLNTQRLGELLADARERYDWIILDSPPVGPWGDTELMCGLVDGVLVVVRAAHAPVELILKTVQTISAGKILGLVLNAT
jgi:capsular exopolysaccharide synthesis family protein